ncbi:MAG: hypothetical protein M3150_02625 [Pseudomonadota bacterium]|nr:hypothetical protein [Pseudomonadota bacterium]
MSISLRTCLGLVLAAIVLVRLGCTTREGATNARPLPLATIDPQQPEPATDMQQIAIQISSDGRFDHDVDEAQSGDARLVLRTHGGPYLFSVDQLVDRRELPANRETAVVVRFTPPQRYTMHLALSTPATATATEATATLDVRPVGSR